MTWMDCCWSSSFHIVCSFCSVVSWGGFYCQNVHYHGGSIHPAVLQPNRFMVFFNPKGNKTNSDWCSWSLNTNWAEGLPNYEKHIFSPRYSGIYPYRWFWLSVHISEREISGSTSLQWSWVEFCLWQTHNVSKCWTMLSWDQNWNRLLSLQTETLLLYIPAVTEYYRLCVFDKLS